MEHETPQTEVIRLIREQNRTREDEVFGGLSPVERAEYNKKSQRINDLEILLRCNSVLRKAPAFDVAHAKQQTTQWTKAPEVDLPQEDARQPYDSREKDASQAATRSPKKKRRNGNDPGLRKSGRDT
jgi:hypothetical protein